MQSWKTVLVIVLLIIVGGYAYYVSRHPKPQLTPNLYSLKSSDIQKIELRSPAHDILIERTKDGWRLVKPITVPADRNTVDNMAEAIANLEITRTLSEPAGGLAAFGLERPAVNVTVTTTDNHTLPMIMVGKDTPVGDSSYIKSAQKPGILLVANTFPSEVEKSVDDLRSRALIGFKPDEIHRVVLDTSNGTSLELDKVGTHWSIVKPKPYAVDASAVQSLLQAISNARVADFINDHPSHLSKYGLSDPSFKVILDGGKSHAQESLLFGYKYPQADKSTTYAQRGEGLDQPVVTVDDYVFNELDKNFDDLRDKTVLALNKTDVARVVISANKLDETLERESGGNWKVIANDKTAPAEHLVADSLLDQLHSLKATKIVEDPMSAPQRYGMVNPTLTLTAYARSGKEIGTVRVSTIEKIVKPRATAVGATQVKPRISYQAYATTNTDTAVDEIPPQAVADFENTASRLHADAFHLAPAHAAVAPAAASRAPSARSTAPAVPH